MQPYTSRPVVGVLMALVTYCACLDAEVEIPLGADWQSIIEANPAGSVYRIRSGEHREQSITPKDGDHFVGDYGALMKGSRRLDASLAQSVGGVWIFSGQTQPLLQFGDGTPRATQVGNDLFLDGERLLHVESRGQVDASGEFYFDPVADEIVLYDNPNGHVVEAVVAQKAADLTGLTGVTFENFTIMHYGSLFRPEGAVIGRLSYDTQIKFMEFRDNHSVGLSMGPGTVIQNSRFYRQGQMGASGGGQIDGGPLLPIVLRDSEFVENHNILEDWETSGAEGALKVTYSRGSVVENCWIRDNWTFGLWFDIRNDAAVIRSNLIENTGAERVQSRSIFFEISGNADIPDAPLSQIYWNSIRRSKENAIDVSSSSNVAIFENSILDGEVGINVRDNNRGQRNAEGLLEGVSIFDNQVQASSALASVSDAVGQFEYVELWDGNQYFGLSQSFRYGGDELDFADWQALAGYDLAGTVVPSATPELPAEAVAFRKSKYGPQPAPHRFTLSRTALGDGYIISYDFLKSPTVRFVQVEGCGDLVDWQAIAPVSDILVEDHGSYERRTMTLAAETTPAFFRFAYEIESSPDGP